MTNTKATKRALLSGVAALFLCFAMLLGTTYAWFTDGVTSSGNKIKSGTLDIDLLVKDVDGAYVSVKDSEAPIFDYQNWEPGYTEVVNLMVKNNGTLALQYSMHLVTEGLVKDYLDNEIKISDVIDVYYADEEISLPTRESFDAAVADGTLKEIGNLTETLFAGAMIKDYLLAGQSDCATVVLKMRESAGNEYQGLSVGTSFDINIFATQYTYEEDAFDNQYDKIELPSATVMVFEKELLEAYGLVAGCAYVATEEWDNAWDYDEVNDRPADGTPEYAYYYADFVISFSEDHAADEIGLWGYYAAWNAQESFQMDAIDAGVDYRIIPIAEDKLNIAMGKISYKQLLTQVEAFGCGLTDESALKPGETVTVTLRLYETKLNGGNSFVETGAYHDIAVYTYTQATATANP